MVLIEWERTTEKYLKGQIVFNIASTLPLMLLTTKSVKTSRNQRAQEQVTLARVRLVPQGQVAQAQGRATLALQQEVKKIKNPDRR